MTDPTQTDPPAAAEPPASIPATADDRTGIGPMRHAYRVLSDEEKRLVGVLKDHGAAFLATLESVPGEVSRELSIARTKIEEAVMWAVKHVTR